MEGRLQTQDGLEYALAISFQSMDALRRSRQIFKMPLFWGRSRKHDGQIGRTIEKGRFPVTIRKTLLAAALTSVCAFAVTSAFAADEEDCDDVMAELKSLSDSVTQSKASA